MKIEFYLNDKTDIPTLLERLAISITLNSLGVHTIYITGNDDKTLEYDIQKIRQEYIKRGFRVLKE